MSCIRWGSIFLFLVLASCVGGSAQLSISRQNGGGGGEDAPIDSGPTLIPPINDTIDFFGIGSSVSASTHYKLFSSLNGISQQTSSSSRYRVISTQLGLAAKAVRIEKEGPVQ